MPHRYHVQHVNEDADEGSDLMAVREDVWLETCPRCGETRKSHGWETCRQCLWDLSDPGWECPRCKMTNPTWRPRCDNDECGTVQQSGWLCGCGHRNPSSADACESCGRGHSE